MYLDQLALPKVSQLEPFSRNLRDFVEPFTKTLFSMVAGDWLWSGLYSFWAIYEDFGTIYESFGQNPRR